MTIIEQGRYHADREVAIGSDIARAVAGTRLHLPDDVLPVPETSAPAAPTIEVTNESSLSAARRLGGDVACLVFASARHPGGGFRTGAQAQEESLARSSALYACLSAVPPFYAHHHAHPDLTYSDRVIYSPAVPVFRDDTGDLLATPYLVSFLTAAAPNRTAVLHHQPERAATIATVLHRRAARVLAVAAHHGHRHLILGAWGCGVFGNEPAAVAAAFAAHLHHSQWFDHVVFAVLDRQPGTPTYAAFTRAFS